MPGSKSTSSVKIYDRPERKSPSPVLMLIALIVVLILGFVVYRFVIHRADATPTGSGTTTGQTRAASNSP
jgi:hypothetical protein